MAVAAAIKVAKAAGPDDIVVVLNPDSGRGYLSRVFDDAWMANSGSSPSASSASARCWTPRQRADELLYVNPDQHGPPGRSI